MAGRTRFPSPPLPIRAISYTQSGLLRSWSSVLPTAPPWRAMSSPLAGTQMIAVDLSRVKKNKSPQISVVENSKDFYIGGTLVAAKSLWELCTSGVSSEPPPRVPQQQPPLRKQAAPPKWKEEADKLGFTYLRQVSCFFNRLSTLCDQPFTDQSRPPVARIQIPHEIQRHAVGKLPQRRAD
ncbi:hypothetical protein V2G26_003870 [Clonostachys chloroleuca]